MRATERTERTRVEAPEDLVVPEEEELEEESFIICNFLRVTS